MVTCVTKPACAAHVQLSKLEIGSGDRHMKRITVYTLVCGLFVYFVSWEEKEERILTIRFTVNMLNDLGINDDRLFCSPYFFIQLRTKLFDTVTIDIVACYM
ncbi:hypothetical protein BDC45DRAFT_533332 [Circinella umbellata]|nr:hypothetical protein BDC45DRAFT_533332 [Circinella umbellata]